MAIDLGKAILTIAVKADDFRKGITGARQDTEELAKGVEKKTGRMRAGFDKVTTSAKNAAGKIPFVGGALTSMLTPMGLATAGAGLAAAAVTKMVTKTLDLGRELGTLRERTGVSAEGIQIWQRAIEETNGSASSFADATMRLQRMIGEAAQGSKGAIEDFDRLGLSWEDLQGKSPEDALQAVVGRTNEVLGPTEAAATKNALLGRSWQQMGGLAHMTTAEIAELTASVADSATVMSGDAVDSVDDFDAMMRNLSGIFSELAVEIGSEIVPLLTDLGNTFKELWPLIKVVINVALLPLKNAIAVISGVVKIVSALLRGDFRTAWLELQKTFLKVVKNLIDAANAVLGIFGKKIDTSGIDKALATIEKETETTADVTEKQTKRIQGDMADTSKSFEKTGNASTEMAGVVAESNEAIIESAKRRTAVVLAKYAKEREAEAELLRKKKENTAAMIAENKKFLDDKHADDLAAWNVTEVEYKLAQYKLKTITGAAYADLMAEAEEYGIQDLALLVAQNRNIKIETDKAIRDKATADATDKADQIIKDGEHNAALLTSLDTHIGLVKDAITTAEGNEKEALNQQLLDLQTQRADAHAITLTDRLAAEQRKIDDVAEKIKTAEGAELAALTAHHAVLIAQMGVLTAGINQELAKIERDIKINFGVTGQFSGGGNDPQGPGDPDRTTSVTFNEDGSISTSESTSDNSQNLYLDDAGNAFYDEALNNPAGDSYQADVDAALGHDNLPGSQHGSLIKGVNNGRGRLIRVGENNTDETILPLPSGMLDALRRGGMSNGNSTVRINLHLGQQEFEDLWVGTADDLFRQNRVNQDLVA